MYKYKVESINLRTQSKTNHGKWDDDDLITDAERSASVRPHDRPGRPAVLWVQHDDDPDWVPLYIRGSGTDPEELISMIGASDQKWGQVK